MKTIYNTGTIQYLHIKDFCNEFNCYNCNAKRLSKKHFEVCDNEIIDEFNIPIYDDDYTLPTHETEVFIPNLGKQYLSDGDECDYVENDIIKIEYFNYEEYQDTCKHNFEKDLENYISVCTHCFEIEENYIQYEIEIIPGERAYKHYYEGYTLAKYENQLLRDLRGFDDKLQPFYISRDFAFAVYDFLRDYKFMNWSIIKKAYDAAWTCKKLKNVHRNRYYTAWCILDLPEIKFDAIDLHYVKMIRKTFFEMSEEQGNKHKSSFNFFYLLYKVMNLRLPKYKLTGIPLKISKVTLLKNESKWKGLCKVMNWKFSRLYMHDLVFEFDLIDWGRLKQKWLSNNLLYMSPIIT